MHASAMVVHVCMSWVHVWNSSAFPSRLLASRAPLTFNSSTWYQEGTNYFFSCCGLLVIIS